MGGQWCELLHVHVQVEVPSLRVRHHLPELGLLVHLQSQVRRDATSVRIPTFRLHEFDSEGPGQQLQVLELCDGQFAVCWSLPMHQPVHALLQIRWRVRPAELRLLPLMLLGNMEIP